MDFHEVSLHLYFTCYFIYQGTSTKRQRRELLRYSSQAVTCYYQSIHSKVEEIPLSALPKNTTSELADLFRTIFLTLNVKQGSCKSQLLKSFGLTQRGNLTRRLGGDWMVGPLGVLVSPFRPTYRIEGLGSRHHVEAARR